MDATVRWGEKRYNSLDYYIKETFHEKLYKLSLNAGCTCPNRDGTCGTRGCIFCSRGGSGDFAADVSLSIPEQLRVEKEKKKSKYSGHSYIAYFQAYTNTYGPLEVLEKAFTQALTDPEVKVLSIATRPDCLSAEILDLLERLSLIKPVWIELGLQTIHESTAEFIRRGYPLPVFEEALKKLRALGLSVIVHTILYLPGESEADMLETIEYLNRQDIQGIKLQLLHVLKDTDLYDYYLEHPFFLPTMEEYLEFLGTCLCCLRPDIVIHRLTGDGPKSLLAAPLWTGNKRLVLNQMEKSFRERNIWQGKHYHAL
ncbi:TIGR01212 family radical SAM protein [Drancourtella massiliensis]|uniref:TIGR01212 family radical SAM protein n=2 Tax=Clostridia TaxID=186801 RepID=A0A9W6CCV4_9FIRM|nr:MULTISPECIES: TIGR01212 family radical SAM protein [Clostridia]MBM6743456.1 TIGR01212 family radical SAM protein [Drancourtella massiliensis]GLG04771.1 TIGR01212 family radical SAM protein [Sellimonas catena]GLG88977.1 TIGR01212 family radical SAM protein [Sellimonas catena]